MSEHTHYIEVCSCGIVLGQCRCMGPKERRVSTSACGHGMAALTAQPAAGAQQASDMADLADEIHGTSQDALNGCEVSAATFSEWVTRLRAHRCSPLSPPDGMRALLGEALTWLLDCALHRRECRVAAGDQPYACTCGLDDLLARLRAEAKSDA